MSSCEQREYPSLVEHLLVKATRDRVPLTGTMELTGRCNLDCVHCYWQGADRRTAEELSTDAVLALFDQLAQAGCLWLSLTGGEPLLRPDFKQIYLEAKRRGFIITLLTNGTLIDEPLSDLLAEHAPFAVEITLYGHTQAVFERVTRAPGSFQRCMEGIERLRQRGVFLRLKTTMTRINLAEVRSMRRFAEGLGLPFRQDGLLNARLDGTPLPAGLAIEARDLVALEMEQPEAASRWRERMLALTNTVSSSTRQPTCGAGISHFHLDPGGKLSPCVMWRQPAMPVADGGFVAAWNGPIQQAVRQAWQHESVCDGCTSAVVCDICPGWSQLERGQDRQAVESLCAVAEQRSRALGLEDDNQKVVKHAG